MRFTSDYAEYKELLDIFTETTKDQNLITNLVKIRKKVSQSGDLETSFDYLSKKRKECILNWENTFGKEFQDKRRRKVFVKTTKEDGSIILRE